ncbi:LytTR family DNA-binding domain-containing protein [Paraflavitalea sp. CAU 1676]|uniref:LytR/AlgR family response regulator transcription factor n=1 Tax=Paraflavitalea sp. CAU 1676 TaxID=3032598 RepID=UPI0023DC88D1|nr:LytTR family DNA-binding domain-containing protein [Paraflavitalea sp. CAU 1676]MDF2190993.1 LytTR family DNA-binding domain-containing protein [Paraflavitalea sp. CAU 1676]
MQVLIIEDEKPAVEKLQKALQAADPAIQVVDVVDSVHQAVDWLTANNAPSLIFMDIELSDGLSFKIFEQVNINCPVIFVTAYDEYWQEAFEHNSIDYLLKPIKQVKLEAALRKYDKLKQHFSASYQNLANWQQKTGDNGYKKRFLVKRGSDFISIKTDDIAYFYATHKLVCMVDHKGQKFILDQSLSDIETQLDATVFYRVNRKYLVNMSAIKRIKTYPKSKLLIELEPALQEEIVISQENVTAFKEWMGQ